MKVLEASGCVPYSQETKLIVVPALHTFDAFPHRLFNVLRKKDGVFLNREEGTITFAISKDREESVKMFLEKELLRGTITEFMKEG